LSSAALGAGCRMPESSLESDFLRLRESGYQITSDPDDRYNCVAWAAGDQRKWWDPSYGYYWPVAARLKSVEGFMSVFRSLGYELCESRDVEPGFEKIAIYANGLWPTHVARQLENGNWTSKCGEEEDIEHNLQGLEGGDNGRVVVVMKREGRPDS